MESILEFKTKKRKVLGDVSIGGGLFEEERQFIKIM
jgi:hypothetical protein